MKLGSKSLALAAAATGALLAASGSPALATSHVKRALVDTPQLTINASKGGTFDVTGPRTFSAGRVNITLHADKGEQEAAIMRLHAGYTVAHLRRDFATYGRHQEDPTPQGMKALNRIVRRTTFYGGLDTGTGHNSATGSVVLNKVGTYYLLNDANGPGASQAVKLHVTTKEGSRTAPTIAAVERATTAKRFRGPVNLPAQGTIEFENAASNSPHFMFLQHVKAGTTRKQVIKSFKSNGPGPELPGAVGTDVLFTGHAQTLTYNLPAGDYAQLCFFPDLKTGMPHAFMGMVRIVHLS
ncbi:MAG TPA: hypothetical protein VHC43_06675 [Mycobacteriales bacterium]|nr:hypothetical protein [Mycobacteriales bacterium]